MVFGLFKKKKEQELPPEMFTPEETPTIPELLEPAEQEPRENEFEPLEGQAPEEPVIERKPVSESLFPDLLPPLHEETEFMSPAGKSATLENLCIKIDLEAEDVERKIKEVKSIVNKLNINSSEIFDLLTLYSKIKDKLRDFTGEIDRFDTAGWGINEERAAFYKFRACKSLAKIRRDLNDIEKIVKQSGFTPSKMNEILSTPAEQLVEQLAKIRSTVIIKPKKKKRR
jgi:hypothetical protein